VAIGTNSVVGKLGAVVTWEDIGAEIRLDYDSKNLILDESADTLAPTDLFTAVLSKTVADPLDVITPSESISVQPQLNKTDSATAADAVAALTVGINITETVSASDLITEYTNGSLNGSELNTRRLASGDVAVLATDISIVIS
jgi:hypothetical protein